MRAVETIIIQCPSCFSSCEVQVEADVNGVLVYDCEVCCHPIELDISPTSAGARATVQSSPDG